jgi:hypothetical protein
MYALRADSSYYADTASYAYTSQNAWYTFGNSNTNPSLNFIGTVDNTPIHLSTNGTKRVTFTTNGRMGVGTETPLADFHVVGNNGLLIESDNTGTIPIEGQGTRLMWYPGKYAFRAGTITSGFDNYWNNNRTGIYSFAFGKNVMSSASYSVSFGEETTSAGDYSMAVGYQSSTTNAAPYSFASGYNSITSAPYAVAMGRGNRAKGEASSAFNYHTVADGDYSQSFGFYSQANGHHSIAIGNRAVANHDGSFVFSDASANTQTISTAANQFMVRAAGGFIFYTSSNLSSGVQLPSGSGSWSSLSDSLSKTNISLINEQEILRKIEKINIYEWSYKSEKSVRHIGPMAQTFNRVFDLGGDNKYISTVDIDGVNMAAVKALYSKSKQIELMLIDYEKLLSKYNALEAEKNNLEERLQTIEKSLTIK